MNGGTIIKDKVKEIAVCELFHLMSLYEHKLQWTIEIFCVRAEVFNLQLWSCKWLFSPLLLSY